MNFLKLFTMMIVKVGYYKKNEYTVSINEPREHFGDVIFQGDICAFNQFKNAFPLHHEQKFYFTLNMDYATFKKQTKEANWAPTPTINIWTQQESQPTSKSV